MGAGLGFAFGHLLTGFLSSFLRLKWQEIFLVFGAIGLPAGSRRFSASGTRRADTACGSRRKPFKPDTPENPKKGSQAGERPFSACLWDSRAFWPLIIFVAGIRDFPMWNILDISDFYLNRVFSGSASTALYLFVMYLPGVFTQPLAGALSDKIGRKKMTTLTLLSYGLSIASLAFLPK